MDEKDRQYKEKMADEGGSSKGHNFVVGDYVLLRQRKRNKWSTPYEPVFYTVIKISGSAITARPITNGLEVQRDASQFKLANVLMYQESVNESGQSRLASVNLSCLLRDVPLRLFENIVDNDPKIQNMLCKYHTHVVFAN